MAYPASQVFHPWNAGKSQPRPPDGSAQSVVRRSGHRVDVSKLLINTDSISNRVARPESAQGVVSTQFTDPTRCHALQAAQLLTCMVVKDLTERSAGRLNAPAWLKTQSGLPIPSGETVCEFWDKAHTDRFLAAVEWDASEQDDRPVRRRKT